MCIRDSQWKEACIRPIAKILSPRQPADFRPISVTPILTRLTERAIVRSFLYAAFLKPAPHLSFSDQFAFRPTGSTTAAIISLLHTVTSMLLTNPFVVVISLDFSKAFDTVRHSTLLTKMAELECWICHYPCTTGWCRSSTGTHTVLCIMVVCRPRCRYQTVLYKVPVSDQRRTLS